jgi:hypothetical protein
MDQVCQECNGHGKHMSKAWKEYFLNSINLDDQTVIQEKPKEPIFNLCKKCKGIGRLE